VKSKYDIRKITPDEAEIIWNESPQSTIFTHPEGLKEVANKVHWWLVSKGEENQCVWPITVDENLKSVIPPFSYWQGPMWTKLGINFPNHRALSKTKPIYELFIDTFIIEYQGFKASLHPSLQDVRVFDWWNYNSPNQPRFSIKPRYTAVIQNLSLTMETLQSNFRTDRRQALKKYEKVENNFYFDSHCTEEEFITLYKDKLKIEKTVTTKDLISVLNVVKKGHGWVQSARLKKNAMLCGLLIVFHNARRANLVINLALPEFKNQGLIPGSILNLINTAKAKGLKYFDFNGANSPARGDDKHSYDAEPVLYFDIEYDTTNCL
jgi:hypothetical protein